jgi:mannosyl-oligosaccharide alpha-1,2-mannosidase
MKFAFDTLTGIPFGILDIGKQSTFGKAETILVAAGTLILERGRLSDLPGDPEYARLAERAELYMINPNPPWNSPWPGLVGTKIM